jgi:hypothetical protein
MSTLQIKMNKELLDLEFVEVLTYQEEIKTGRFNTPQSRVTNDTKTRFVVIKIFFFATSKIGEHDEGQEICKDIPRSYSFFEKC